VGAPAARDAWRYPGLLGRLWPGRRRGCTRWSL